MKTNKIMSLSVIALLFNMAPVFGMYEVTSELDLLNRAREAEQLSVEENNALEQGNQEENNAVEYFNSMHNLRAHGQGLLYAAPFGLTGVGTYYLSKWAFCKLFDKWDDYFDKHEEIKLPKIQFRAGPKKLFSSLRDKAILKGKRIGLFSKAILAAAGCFAATSMGTLGVLGSGILGAGAYLGGHEKYRATHYPKSYSSDKKIVKNN